MLEVCPDAWLAQLHQPDGDEPHLSGAGRARHQGGRALPLGLLDGARPVRADRRADRGGDLLVGRRQPSGLAAALGARRRGASIRCSTSGSRPTRSCGGGSVSTCTGGWATTRPRPASIPRSTCRGISSTTKRSSGCASSPACTSGISEDNVATYERDPARSWPPASRSSWRASATEYAPQVVHSMVTGTKRRIVGNVVNTGPDQQPARRGGRRGAVPRRRDGRAPDVRRRAATAVRRPQPRLPQRRRSDRAAAVEGDPRLVRQAAMVDPNTSGHALDPRRDLGPVRRPGRTRTAPCCPSRCGCVSMPSLALTGRYAQPSCTLLPRECPRLHCRSEPTVTARTEESR